MKAIHGYNLPGNKTGRFVKIQGIFRSFPGGCVLPLYLKRKSLEFPKPSGNAAMHENPLVALLVTMLNFAAIFFIEVQLQYLLYFQIRKDDH